MALRAPLTVDLKTLRDAFTREFVYLTDRAS